jgi:rhodanese-related sulfurtransferase
MKRLLVILLVAAVLLSAGCLQAPPALRIFSDITAKQALDLIQNNQGNPNFVIIDVRSPAEFDSGHIENAINIDKNSETFKDELNKLDKDKTYLVYCAMGSRSAGALVIMEELGFMKAYNMKSGLNQWQADGLPITE